MVINPKKNAKLSVILYIFVIIVLISFRIWLLWGYPKIQLYAPHDDLYFVKIATNIKNGNWLGAYDSMTIIKVPFYAFFLVVASFIPLPLLAIENIVYVISCLIFLKAIQPLQASRWIKLICFAILLFSPISLTTGFVLRVYREFLNLSLSLLVASLTIGILFRINSSPKQLLTWNIFLGLGLGAFVITREEGIWIIPVQIIFTLIACLYVCKYSSERKWLTCLILCIPVAIFQVPTQIVSEINQQHYGFYGTSETLDPDFNKVINTLGRIKTNNWTPYVQVNHEARQKSYRVSPLFKSMQNNLETNVGNWRYYEMESVQTKPEWLLHEYKFKKGDSGGGYFLWIFRNSLSDLGYYDKGSYPREFLHSLAIELEDACNNGSLECKPQINIPLIGSIDKRHIPIITRLAKEDLLKIIRMADIDTYSFSPNHWKSVYYIDDDYHSFTKNDLEIENYITLNNPQNRLSPGAVNKIAALNYRNKIIQAITNSYKLINPILVVCSIVAGIWLIYNLVNREINKGFLSIKIQAIIYLVFLVVFRFGTLMVIEATTTNPAYNYRGSVYIFIHLLCFISLLTIVELAHQKRAH